MRPFVGMWVEEVPQVEPPDNHGIDVTADIRVVPITSPFSGVRSRRTQALRFWTFSTVFDCFVVQRLCYNLIHLSEVA